MGKAHQAEWSNLAEAKVKQTPASPDLAYRLCYVSSLPRRLRRSELAEVFEHGETLRLQFPKEDLGYVYAQGAGEGQSGNEHSCVAFL